MSVTETIVGIIGELMLFLTSAFLVAAVATALLALDRDTKEYVAIGTPFVVAAGAMYTARGYLEQRRWVNGAVSAGDLPHPVQDAANR